MELMTERVSGIRLTKSVDLRESVMIDLATQKHYRLAEMSNKEMEEFYEVDKPRNGKQ